MTALRVLNFMMVAFSLTSAIALADEQPQAGQDPGTMLQEITVTAQRRTESVQKSSVAIEVLTSEDLRQSGITGPRDITAAVPGVQIGAAGAATQIYIRGVGDQSNNPNSNPGVAVNVDGVYVARPAAVNGNFYDLERVEILKGPQGTLYGRNASGGAINLITKRPEIDRFNGYVDVGVGNYDLLSGNGAVNLPINDQFAVRGAFQVVRRDGFATNDFDDDREQEGRLSALWTPSDKLSLLLVGDYAHQGGTGAAFVYVPGSAVFMPGQSPRADVTVNNSRLLAAYAHAGLCFPAALLPPTPAYSGVFAGACNPGFVSLANPLLANAAHQDNQFWNVHAELNWDLEFATLTFLPAYRDTKTDYVTYATDVQAPHVETSKMSSVEVRLAKEADWAKWVVGLYDYNEKQTETTRVNVGLVDNASSFLNPRTRAYAGFGEATFNIASPWRLITGVRYTSDKRSMNDGQISRFEPDLVFITPGSCFQQSSPCLQETIAGDRTFRSVTWKGGTEFDLTPDSMLFLTASTGFKAGGIQLAPTDRPGIAGDYQPEKLLAYELGSRNRFLDNRLQLNMEAFYWKYKDHQGFTIALDADGNLSRLITNDGDAKIYGVDVDTVAVVSAHDWVHWGFEYLDASYVRGALAGRQMPISPKWSGIASYKHTFDLPGGATLVSSLEAQAASKRWLSTDYVPWELGGSYVTENVSLTYQSAHNRWSGMLYARNISDQVIYLQGVAGSFLGPASFASNVSAPRTFGAHVTVNF